ncbi:MAG: alkaline phosphatase D family protein [Rhizobiaceae bacterium]|nr:alkaline phosphatase D family protein [Rhizobiaceae bacterium]
MPRPRDLSYDDSLTAWISKGFEHLVERVRKAEREIHFDVLIVGSGYGGSVAASTFAGLSRDGKLIRVGVLERGNEYLPGSFATGLEEFPRYVRHGNNKQGLYDIRAGSGVITVAANGLGGGSLVNAGVMVRPRDRVFAKGWPQELSNVGDWSGYFDRAEELLGARIGGKPNTIASHPDGVPRKSKAIGELDPSHFSYAPLTVAMSDTRSSGNVALKICKRCGDCATGCNFGAKNSLDVNLLAKAHQNRAEIFTGATVLNVARHPEEGWLVETVYTDATLRRRDQGSIRIRTRKLILSAGTMGSTEILLRSQESGLRLSSARIGKQCSTNGDMLVVDFATQDKINSVADSTVKPSERAIGPTITGMIDLRDGPEGVLVEELSVPASLRVAFAEIFATANTLHGLAEIDWSRHEIAFPADDGIAVTPGNILNSALYAVMGDDGASGSIELPHRSALPEDESRLAQDGVATMRWATLPDLPLFARQAETIESITEASGGRKIANPMWRLLPPKFAWLLENKQGPLTTVHPLGGCVMGDDGGSGVVNHLGQVFSGDATASVYDDLVVLDGSIIPSALAANPALTISAVALRASEILAERWALKAGADADSDGTQAELQRPVFRGTDVAAVPSDTEVEIVERLVGPVRLQTAPGKSRMFIAELTLRIEPKAICKLMPGMGGDGVLRVSQSPSGALKSRLRIFPLLAWKRLEGISLPPLKRERKLEAMAVFSAPVTGTLSVLHRAPSGIIGRIWRAGTAWLLNRGLRDTYQSLVDGDGGGQYTGGWQRIKAGLGIASKSGAIRTLSYDLTVGTPELEPSLKLTGMKISGTKTFSYMRRGNPWRQLMDVSVDRFPGLQRGETFTLKLDTGYLAQIGIPLFQITKQLNAVGALAELGMFAGYFIRLLLTHHIWSFRAPDIDVDPANDYPDFLPPRFLSLSDGRKVKAETIHIPIVEIPQFEGKEVDGKVLITRYPQEDTTTARPVVMLHGYSAGGTTFAHHAVNPNLASHLWEAGRDIWIADLRTSPAHDATCQRGWSFDQIGKKDVADVIELAASHSATGEVDVVAHCMGTIVFSFAMLGEDRLAGKVNRAAFTQVGPLVVFTPANVFRGYIVHYLLNYLPTTYSFNPSKPSLADDLWDRALATLPYPVEEFDIENPVLPWKRTPWTRTRHRMDALYGRDFSLAKMEPDVLRFINEHFGALNLRTVATTLHYVRHAMMTNYKGRNKLVSRSTLKERFNFPLLSIHGKENGLSHFSTVSRMKTILDDAGCKFVKPFINPGAGHQDSLIGTTRYPVFARISEFLDDQTRHHENKADTDLCAYPPWIGPILTKESALGADPLAPPVWSMRIGSLPSHPEVVGGVILPVKADSDGIVRPDGQAWTENYIANHMVLFWSEELSREGWDTLDLSKLVSKLPCSNPDHSGNALLLVLIYAEDDTLARKGTGVENNADIAFDVRPRLSRRSPLNTNDSQTIKTTLDRDRFDRSAKAVYDALLFQSRPRRIAGRPSSLDENFDSDRILTEGIIPRDVLEQPATIRKRTGTTFLLASCQYPAGLLDTKAAYRSYELISERLELDPPQAPRFMLFVGDQVYVDPTAGLYDPASLDDRYRLPYENWLRQPAVRKVLRRAPSFMLLDDHEIDDNWEPIPNDRLNEDKMDLGRKAYRKYQRGFQKDLETFEFDGFHFFLMDTRSERFHRKVGNLHEARLVAGPTMARLKKFLREKPGPKFVVTPLMLLPRHRRAVQWDRRLDSSNLSALHSDGWDGYPDTLRELLGYIAINHIEQVVFLSGDEHRGCIATGELRDGRGKKIVEIHSIHTSALYAPFPFANGVDQEIVDEEEIEFGYGGRRFKCAVKALRPTPGDGATFLKVRKQGRGWRLDCEFSDGIPHSLRL